MASKEDPSSPKKAMEEAEEEGALHHNISLEAVQVLLAGEAAAHLGRLLSASSSSSKLRRKYSISPRSSTRKGRQAKRQVHARTFRTMVFATSTIAPTSTS